jgi:hypothetical protein
MMRSVGPGFKGTCALMTCLARVVGDEIEVAVDGID